ncbi:DNA double-strand break repair helicase HerA [Candidatus Anstonella stagnisolia]|nr:DNA double-strand break repair helicase HerA [Candidatus Anstonella stagnisolia]
MGSALEEMGTVISTFEGPTTVVFSFVVGSKNVRKGQFVQVEAEDGLVLGSVSEITRANRYFESAESVAEYERSSPMSTNFPTTDWEYIIANVRVHGMFKGGLMIRSTFPVAPGIKVHSADEELLKKFLHFEENGLFLGTLANHKLEAKVNLNKLLQKHLAILAMSGSGKSYLASVLIEELMERKAEKGRMGIVIIDSHGEYAGFRSSQYGKSVSIVDGKKIRIPLRKIAPALLFTWMPDASSQQKRELEKIMLELKKDGEQTHNSYGLSELVEKINASENLDKKSKPALLGWVGEIRSLKLVGKEEYPKIGELVKPGCASVVDLSGIDGEKKKQVIVSYVAKKLFSMRKKEKIAPFVLMLEEAHNYAPEKMTRKVALAKGAIETIAREGRKFGASLCLISQRPVHLSVTALSQCNTNIILRVTNPNDIKRIGESCEGIDDAMLSSITTLRVGEALLVGEATGSPVFIKVRQKKSSWIPKGQDLEEIARKFEEAIVKKKTEVEAFL